MTCLLTWGVGRPLFPILFLLWLTGQAATGKTPAAGHTYKEIARNLNVSYRPSLPFLA